MGRRLPPGLVLVVAVALLVRVAAIALTPDFRPLFDASHYDRLAASIADGGSYFGQFNPPVPSAFRPPLFPLALTPVRAAGLGWTSERLLNAVFGSVVVLLVMLVARRVWGRRVGLVAGALAAVFPPLVTLSASLLSEPLFLVLVLAVVLCVLEYREHGRTRWAAAAGVLCGLAALTRVNGLVLVIPAGLAVWTARPRWGRRAILIPVTVVMFAALATAPWVVRNAVVFDRFVGISTQSGYAIAATYNAESARRHPAGRPLQTQSLKAFADLYSGPMDEGRRGSELTSRGTNYAVHHPGYVAKTFFWNTLRVLDVHRDDTYRHTFEGAYLQALGVERLASPIVPVSLYLVLVLALGGVVTEVRNRRGTRAPAFVWAVPLLLVIPSIAVYGLARYRSPADPFLLMLAAVALVAGYDRVRTSRGRP